MEQLGPRALLACACGPLLPGPRQAQAQCRPVAVEKEAAGPRAHRLVLPDPPHDPTAVEVLLGDADVRGEWEQRLGQLVCDLRVAAVLHCLPHHSFGRSRGLRRTC
eukprot:8548246-Lingulodinium_polyedra.AAC.1